MSSDKTTNYTADFAEIFSMPGYRPVVKRGAETVWQGGACGTASEAIEEAKTAMKGLTK